MLCSVQPAPLDADAFLRDPDALLEPPPAALCDALDVGAGDLLRHVVHVEAHDASCGGRAFQRVVGRLVVRHPRSHRIARLPFVSDQMTAGDSVYAITRLTYEGWSADGGARTYLSALEARVRMRLLPSRRVTRQDVEFVAVPAAHMPPASDAVRAALARLRCQFGVNVSLATEAGGTATFRCTLLPVRCLGATAPLPTAALWCVVAPGAGECVVVAAAARRRGARRWATRRARAPPRRLSRASRAPRSARVRREVLAQLPALPADARLVDALHAAAAPAGARRYDVVAQPVGCVVALTLAPPEARGGAA